MYTIKIQYVDNSCQSFEHILKVEYTDGMDETFTVLDNEILQHNFPLGFDLFLFAENAKYSASGRSAKFISVFKEQ
ncbi:Hypothetical protein DPCES_2277 [Desulfitobacterium hafniense]|uniref:Uncharacterized protein n=1 Tax=Desulfitobacterium hafniense TaxID=49338 RepID=A0A098AZU7_DESHA|nr:hypothetical protein [Desulfitobacterium hafniense]CDX02164.1 Hypothetical protein DPCES_2277 [Desulfitobacterium hafniense]